jgi:hypothetical protein
MALLVPLSRFTSRVGGGSAFFVRPLSIMKKFIFTTAVALLTSQLPAAIILAMSSLGDGRYQIVAPAPPMPAPFIACFNQPLILLHGPQSPQICFLGWGKAMVLLTLFRLQM